MYITKKIWDNCYFPPHNQKKMTLEKTALNVGFIISDEKKKNK